MIIQLFIYNKTIRIRFPYNWMWCLQWNFTSRNKMKAEIRYKIIDELLTTSSWSNESSITDTRSVFMVGRLSIHRSIEIVTLAISSRYGRLAQKCKHFLDLKTRSKSCRGIKVKSISPSSCNRESDDNLRLKLVAVDFLHHQLAGLEWRDEIKFHF